MIIKIGGGATMTTRIGGGAITRNDEGAMMAPMSVEEATREAMIAGVDTKGTLTGEEATTTGTTTEEVDTTP